MATITIKNIPDELYDRLKQTAEANRRSVNSEVIVCIERAVGSTIIDPATVVRAARRLREKMAGPPLTDDEITRAKELGRP